MAIRECGRPGARTSRPPHHGSRSPTTGSSATRASGRRDDRAWRGSVMIVPMDYKLELVAVPVTDVDRAKAFYTEKAGFIADHDHQVSDELRFVQLTPPGSA